MENKTYEISVHIEDTREAMGRSAGLEVVRHLKEAINQRGSARLMLAAAPSQASTLRMVAESGLEFDKLVCFHMDDYIGLAPDAPQGFGNWLQRHFFSLLPSEPVFHRINTTVSPERAAAEYTELMGTAPFDVTLCGLGVNAHIAFNDPPADFSAADPARVVLLDEVSRQQQVDEGHFGSLEEVPTHAITVTIPRLLSADWVVCCVPGEAKRAAVAATLTNELDPRVPGTALKTHPRAALYLDRESAPR